MSIEVVLPWVQAATAARQPPTASDACITAPRR